MTKTITEEQIRAFERHLILAEKARATVVKYLYDVRQLADWLEDRALAREEILAYKAVLIERYAPVSVNAALASLSSFFDFCGRPDLRVKNLKIQRQIFASSERELTRAEYERLLRAASAAGKERLCLLMQTICATGLRVSELRYITVEAVRRGEAQIRCKGKRRRVLLPSQLCRLLGQYIKERKITGGAVFVTKQGNPPDRSNIWSEMKRLCRAARVSEKKVFPHNLRHLFARTYYRMERDIVRLADILGHANVNTTRIYTMESGQIHRKQIERLGLLQHRGGDPSVPHNAD